MRILNPKERIYKRRIKKNVMHNKKKNTTYFRMGMLGHN